MLQYQDIRPGHLQWHWDVGVLGSFFLSAVAKRGESNIFKDLEKACSKFQWEVKGSKICFEGAMCGLRIIKWKWEEAR